MKVILGLSGNELEFILESERSKLRSDFAKPLVGHGIMKTLSMEAFVFHSVTRMLRKTGTEASLQLCFEDEVIWL